MVDRSTSVAFEKVGFVLFYFQVNAQCRGPPVCLDRRLAEQHPSAGQVVGLDLSPHMVLVGQFLGERGEVGKIAVFVMREGSRVSPVQCYLVMITWYLRVGYISYFTAVFHTLVFSFLVFHTLVFSFFCQASTGTDRRSLFFVVVAFCCCADVIDSFIDSIASLIHCTSSCTS